MPRARQDQAVPRSNPDLALHGWGIRRDSLLRIGHRRFRAPWSIPRIRGETVDHLRIDLTTGDRQLSSALPGGARGAPARPDRSLAPASQGTAARSSRSIGCSPRKGMRGGGALRRPRTDRQAGLVREALLSGDGHRVRTANRQARRWAEAWQARGPGVRTSRTPCHRGSRGVPGGVTAPLLCQTFPQRLARPVWKPNSHAKVRMRKVRSRP